MIVPMKKISLIILKSQKQEALKELGKLGLMQIEIKEGSGEKLLSLKEQLSLLEGGVFALSDRLSKKTEFAQIPLDEAVLTAQKIRELGETKKENIAKKSSYKAELDRLSGFGEIEPQKLKALEEKGLSFSLYQMPYSEYVKLCKDITTLVLSKSKKTVKFLSLKSGGENEAELIGAISGYEVELPSRSTLEIKNEIDVLEEQIKQADAELSKLSKYYQSLKDAVLKTEKLIELEIYKTGMTDQNLSQNTDERFSLAHFKGYIEAENLDKLKKAAEENSWGMIAEEPTEDDDVPTKLKNNKFVSLIYPLTDFLGTVPGYFEYDISGWFLGFILIFFGIIFGDGGYGLLITAVALIPILKALVNKKSPSPTFLLVGLFGLSTIVWGTLTCTWFGLSPENLPSWLKSLSVPVISNVYADKIWYPFWTNGEAGLTSAQNLQILCFSLALVQLTVAHIKGAVRNRKSLKMLGDIGSILQLLGIFYVVLSFVVNAQVFSFSLVIAGIPVGTVAIALVAVGFVTSFVFANYEGSVLKSVLSSLTNIVSVLLGVVNVFSDIVSYIRLWAVGLAGAAISATVNELAGPLIGNFMFMILAIVLLVFGHGLNMILNVLSVIVHGIRLNTLEFSSHLDMSWSGHKFKPFEE